MTQATGTGKYEQLLERCRGFEPIPTAVAHPCEETALAGAIDAGKQGLITPILVGPIAKIKEIAKQAGIDLGRVQIVDTAHSNASAENAVELVRDGKAELRMKGSLHSDELLGAVVTRESGMRPGRRISHVFIMDIMLAGPVALLNGLCGSLADFVREAQTQRIVDHVSDVIHDKSVAVDLEYYENPAYHDTLHRAQQEAAFRPTSILNGLMRLGQNTITLRNGIRPDNQRRKDITIPVDARGGMRIAFVGPWGAMKHYNFSDIFFASDNPDLLEAFQDELEGRTALVSDISTGSADMGQVPIDEVYPLSGVHANAVKPRS